MMKLDKLVIVDALEGTMLWTDHPITLRFEPITEAAARELVANAPHGWVSNCRKHALAAQFSRIFGVEVKQNGYGIPEGYGDYTMLLGRYIGPKFTELQPLPPGTTIDWFVVTPVEE
jgi:hypothetical protein